MADKEFTHTDCKYYTYHHYLGTKCNHLRHDEHSGSFGFDEEGEACSFFKKKTFCATASCEILGKSIESIALMYELTKYLVRSNEKNLLQEYNRVGPICAEYIRNDKTAAQEFYERAVVPSINLIENKEYEQAKILYCSIMQEYLERYSIDYDKQLL